MEKLNLDFFFQLGLFGFFAFLLWTSRSYPFESRFYPQLVGGISMVFLLASMVIHFLQKGEEKKVDPDLPLKRRRFLQVCSVIVLATVVGFLGGFILGVLCYYVVYALLQEDKSKLIQNLVIGAALTVFYYVSFGWFMKVPMLQGWLINF